MKTLTVSELVNRYLLTRTNARRSTQSLHELVRSYLTLSPFGTRPVTEVKTSDAKLFFLGLQEAGKSYSTIHNFRSVLRPAFQMAADDDLINKNPFSFSLASIIPKTTEPRQALTKEEELSFLEFLKASPKWSSYYDVVYVLFHTGLRISEFCGLTATDIDFSTGAIHVNKQLKRYGGMEFVLEDTKTSAGKRDFPMTEDLCDAFRRIIAQNNPVSSSKASSVASTSSDLLTLPFLYRDKQGLPFTAFHWDKLFQRMTREYNLTHEKPLPRLTPHVCRHTFCTRMASAGMNPKALQYLMGHSSISITLNVYTHIHSDDARSEFLRITSTAEATPKPS